MKLSIVIVNYRSGNLVRESLKVLHRNKPEFAFEVIVVDNSCDGDFGRRLKEEFPDANYISLGENTGFARGNNIGIKSAKGEYILILNPDIIITPLCLELMLSYLEKDSGIGIVAPQLLNPDGSAQVSCHRFPRWFTPILRRTILGNFSRARKHLYYYEMRDLDRQNVSEVDWVMGACLMMRAKTLEEVGYFDERFFLYFEDTDLCRRFKDRGCRVVCIPSAKMFHFHKRASSGRPILFSLFHKPSREHIKSAFKYFWKYRKCHA